MSNVEANPIEMECAAAIDSAATEPPPPQLLQPRAVPLGGPRAMSVRRTLPQRARSLVGAWCFADHYGPDDVTRTGGMVVPPHPHTGLQTVSWLFAGEIEHRDSLGVHALVRPGEVNLMTGGHGICHSEVSTPATSTLHGVQLWIALPDAQRDVDRDFHHHVPDVVDVDGGRLRVFVGRLAGVRSPVPTYTPLLGAELVVDAGAEISCDVDPRFEHAVLADTAAVHVDRTEVPAAAMAYLPPHRSTITVANHGTQPARTILLGGEPLDEEIVMWWNFVGRSHAEIVGFRDEWQRETARFGRVPGYRGDPRRLPAPELPNTVLKPRRNPAGGHA